MREKLVAFDCDSTLSAIEGVDELGRLSSPEVFAEVEKLTNEAMDGKIPLGEVFKRRLDLVRPGLDLCRDMGQLYIEKREEGVERVISDLRRAGWEVVILSGGFLPCIEPFADFLGVEEVEAVPLFFDREGLYSGFDEDYPTTRNGGKPEILASLRSRKDYQQVVMVGDGVSDLEAREVADFFIAYTGVVARDQVVRGADFLAPNFQEVSKILSELDADE